ncbi:LLM class flavin-dependent oxidoreductase [Pyxidicoccus fallax]|uniref:Luciferase-like monooxygenase n=1 Tax=Pyxidicoccus fallax TaxID=394095 RepID=A0A848LW85_9BACT|nr:LLM class flavin-dependent oxidoreductase [Pyxidicoccus fallax]NMO22337.1 LLM class flavin-dependent oxidoreductase [Pyxidicoccus fallax]NPC86641.1 LLM class flavin-dependent oxidoreductase [Pyxidicoccus fallax]
MKLSVLDHSLIGSGSTAREAFQNTLELARATEQLGYHRYWLAEHHGSGHFAGVAPEVLAAQVAAATSRIRVGTGGVLLTHYSPFKVAEVFRLLETLYPGRIDLGLGRAQGSTDQVTRALAYGASVGPETFPKKLADLIAFLSGTEPASEEFRGLPLRPATEGRPQLWSLGSGEQSAALAARHGISFCFAHFFNPITGAPVTRGYRAQFKPSAQQPAPYSAVSVYVVCGRTEEEARRLGRSNDLLAVNTRKGRAELPIPSVEEAEAYQYSPEELATLEFDRKRLVFGDPSQVKEQLQRMAADFEVDELIITTICHDHRARLRSYELVAEAFALSGATSRRAAG